MKRCPHCEFIYEDDQSLCDMDGRTLVYDQVFSVSHSPAVANEISARQSPFRGIAAPTAVGLLLAGVICIGYYVSLGVLGPATENHIVQIPAHQADLNQPVQNYSMLSFFSAGWASSFEESSETISQSTSTDVPSDVQLETLDKASHAHRTASDDRLESARTVPPLPRLRPLPRLPNAKPLDRKAASAATSSQTLRPSAPAKKDSKIGSFLKKTGRALSKPFKL